MRQGWTLLVLVGMTWTLRVSGQASFRKDFEANFGEIDKIGGDFLPKFEFEEFFKKIDEDIPDEEEESGELKPLALTLSLAPLVTDLIVTISLT